MKKIVWLHSHFNYWMGGTKLVYQIITRLNKSIPVNVIVENYSEYALKQYESADISIHKTTGVTSTSAVYWINLPKFLNKDFDAVKQYIDKDTIIFSSMFPMNAVANRFDNPTYQYIFEPFAFIHEDYLINNLPLPKKIFTKYIAQQNKDLDICETQKSDKIFTLNDVTAQAIKRIYGKDAIPTYTGIDEEFFKTYDVIDLKEKYKGRRVLIHPTDFTPIKGTDMIIKTLPLVKEKYPNLLVLITSTIDDKQGWLKIQKMAKDLGVLDNIEYLGFIPQKDIPRYYSFAEILLQAGIVPKTGTTSFALPVKEALALGTPVIRNPITTEDAQHMISGLLIDAKDTKAYADGIIYLLDNPDIAKEMGRKGRAKMKKVFTWDKVIKTILDNIT